MTPRPDPSKPSRRAFLAGTAAAGALAWVPAFRVTPASAQATSAAPPNFPPSISLYQQGYSNWAGMTVIDNLWTCAPATPADVVTLANWAQANGWRLRAKGMSHNWSPILLPQGNSGAGYLLVDTTQHLTSCSVSAGSVTTQTGTTMDTLTAAVAKAGYGMAAIPAPGDITIGGMLAINAHGSALPASGETRPAGMTYGSLSNLILSLTAVVWDASKSQYVLKTFQRTDPDIRPFLAHLGRAFLTEVTLQLGPSQNLRCQSWVNQAIGDVFAPPSPAGSVSFANQVTSSGRIEAIWFPFTANPWMKIWSVTPSKPLLSIEKDSPYNYGFSYGVTASENAFFNQVAQGDTAGTPAQEGIALALVDTGLVFDGVWDIWGQWQNMLLYVKPDTVRIVEAGYAVITSRANIQQVVSDFYAQYTSRLSYYQNLGQYPINGPIEIRVTGLDKPSEVIVSGAQSPIFSSVRPRPDHPEWDPAVWLDMGSLPPTPGLPQFYAEMESWIWSHYTGSYATVRPEWSKAWACGASGPWTDPTILGTTVPATVSAGQASGDGWSAGVAILTKYDPAGVFSNPFLDTLMG